jgi:hypothetical protein
VQESDVVTPGSGTGLGVDEMDPAFTETGEGLLKIRNPIGDVMKTRATALQEAPHSGLGPEGLQEFDGAREGNPDTLGLQGFHRGTAFPGQEFEKTAGLLQGGHGHGDVVQWVGEHIRVVAWVMKRQDPGDA